jgi:type IV secretory pathway TraG/TraD family ATPase VirD4
MELIYSLANFNYSIIKLADSWLIESLTLIVFTLSLFGFSPLRTLPEHTFNQIILVKIRTLLLATAVIFTVLFLFAFFFYAGTDSSSLEEFQSWLMQLLKDKFYLIIIGWFAGLTLRFIFYRYIQTLISAISKRLRLQQRNDKLSDIRDEIGKYQAKHFTPSKFYKSGKRFIGLDENNKPQYIDEQLYRETHHQIIGPTRYGKGVMLGNLIDQAINAGDGVIYIDPKGDNFLPYIMYAAAKRNNKKFYFLSLCHGEPGRWQPFAGGDIRSALSRATQAFDLEETGGSDADYYKTLEVEALTESLSKGRHINAICNHVENNEQAAKLKSKTKQWAEIDTFSGPIKNSFSVEKALLEGAIVYVKGHLQDKIVKAATKVFISEVISESMRLTQRKDHLSLYVDEIKFLVSSQITDALSTAAGFRTNITLAYQSLSDTLSPDDQRLNGRSLTDSININCQLKSIYGGSHPETASYAAEMSGKIYKQVTRFERTEIQDAGAEVWEKSRTVGNQEESLIDENVFYGLPSRVCIQFVPSQLTSIIYSAFVPVTEETRTALDNYLEKLNQRVQSKTETPEEKPTDTDNDESTDITETGFITMKKAKLSKLNEPETESLKEQNPEKQSKIKKPLITGAQRNKILK